MGIEMISNEDNQFGDRLLAMLRCKKMTQKELAERSGITERALQYYIHNERIPNVETLYKMAVILKTSMDNLLGVKIAERDPALCLAVAKEGLQLGYDNWNSMQKDDFYRAVRDCEERRDF